MCWYIWPLPYLINNPLPSNPKNSCMLWPQIPLRSACLCVCVCMYMHCNYLSCELGWGHIKWQTLERIICLCGVWFHAGGQQYVCVLEADRLSSNLTGYVWDECSAICKGTPMVSSSNPPLPKIHVPHLVSLQDSTNTGLCSQTGWQSLSLPPDSLPCPVSNSATCQTEQLPLGWVIMQESGHKAGPGEVKDWERRKWLKEIERDRLWT